MNDKLFIMSKLGDIIYSPDLSSNYKLTEKIRSSGFINVK